MQRISLEIYTSAAEAVKIVSDIADHKVELEIPSGSVLLDNILNLEIIQEQAKKTGKEVTFVTDDEYGKNLISILLGEKDEVVVREAVVSTPVQNKVVLPALPKVNIKFKPNLSRLKVIIPVFFLLLAGIGLVFLFRLHKASVTLYFSPQVLTKSVGVKVGDGLKTNLETKVLGGLKVATSIDHALSTNATGTVLEGEKAKGKVKLYNPTSESITLKKGTQLTYKNKDTSYIFTTKSEVSVPAATDDPVDPGKLVKGTAKVEVTAEDIGDDYNLDIDKTLSVKGYKSSQLTAESSEDFEGGSSEEVKVVTQADITKLELDLNSYVTAQLAGVLTSRVPASYTFIDKSEKVASKNVVINNKVGDKKDQLSGTITAQVEGLAYSRGELADFMGKLSQNLVPPGYEFYSYNKELKVDILGNTEKTVLSSTEADLQVTFKFFIVPKVDKEKVFEQIKGMSLNEAVDELNKINGMEKVELNITPNLPFFSKIPSRMQNVDIQIKIGG